MREIATEWTGQDLDSLDPDPVWGLTNWGLLDGEYARFHRATGAAGSEVVEADGARDVYPVRRPLLVELQPGSPGSKCNAVRRRHRCRGRRLGPRSQRLWCEVRAEQSR